MWPDSCNLAATMRLGTIRQPPPATCFALLVLSLSTGVKAEHVAVSPNIVSTVRAADSPRVDNSPHNVWLKAQYLRVSGAMQLAEYGVESGTGARVGAAAGYAYRVAESLSIGVGANIHGFRIGDNGSDQYSYRSAYSFSVPLLLSFDPHVSQSLRLVMTAGLGYEHAWGNDDGMRDDWSGDGLTALAELGVAVRVLPKLEVLATAGARGGVVNAKKFENWFHYLAPVFTWAAPLEVGVRYSL